MADSTATEVVRRAGPMARRLGEELAPRAMASALSAAVVMYLLSVILTLSIAALIYSGPLVAALPLGVGGMLLGAAALTFVVGAFGSCGASIATTQDAPGAIIALGTAAAVGAMVGADTAVQQATVVALVLVVTLTMGAVYLVLGLCRSGALVRYLPYPVMGGFLAGTGWLLLDGGLRVATQLPLGPALLAPDAAARWLPAVLLGLAMLLAQRRWNSSPVLVAALCLFSIGAFHAVTWWLELSTAQVSAAGWLLGPFPESPAQRSPLSPATLAAVDTAALVQSLPVAAPAVLVGAMAMLLNSSGFELIVKRDMALDRDLVAHGAGNLLSGLVGGSVGYIAISISSVGHTLSGVRRLPGLLTALLMAMTALLGTELVALVPRLAMGGLLVYVGVGMMVDWLLPRRASLSWGDFAVVLAIFSVIVLKDFLWGVGLGLALALLMFVFSYSRIDVVRHELTGRACRSRVRRGARHSALLQERGDETLVLKLQGFVFFGTANALVERVRRRVAQAPRRCVQLDFEQVQGVDTTALMGLSKLLLYAQANDIELVFSGLEPRIARRMKQVGLQASTPHLHICADMDSALEWCEDRLLASAGVDPAGETSLREELRALLPGHAVGIDLLLAQLSTRDLAAGERLIREGDEADELYFIASGQFTARLEREGSEELRLETVRAGGIVGEVGFFLELRRSAAVMADTAGSVCVLHRSQRSLLAARAPAAARCLDALAVHVLGRRVLQLTETVQALQN